MTTDGIILAAGYSGRAGINKMTLKLGDKTVIEHCIEYLYPYCSRIIVVGGYRIEEIETVLFAYSKVELVFNPLFSEGMYSSVKAGLKHVKSDRFLLTPGDMPIIQRSTIEKMLNSNNPIVLPVYQGQSGHPVLINSSLIPEILDGNYYCLRDFILKHHPQKIEVNDIGIIYDIDYLDDYYKILSLY